MKEFLYIKVQEYLLDQIQSNEIKPGAKIPSERKLCEILNLSRMTVKNGIDKLVSSKILYKIHGKGTYVSESLNHNGRLVISAKSPISIKMNNIILGKITRNVVLSFKLLYDNENLHKKFNDEKDFYELIRIRYSGDIAYSVEYCYFPFGKFKDAIRYDFSKLSLYDYMKYKRKLPINFVQEIQIEKNNKINSMLNIEKDSHVFKIEFNGRTDSGEYVEYTVSYILLNEVEFKYKIKNK